MYTALEVITSVYSTYLDFDTTHAFIRILLRLKNGLHELKEDESINQDEILNIENKIFEHVYRVLKQNKHNLNNSTDLILFLETFNKNFLLNFYVKSLNFILKTILLCVV